MTELRTTLRGLVRSPGFSIAVVAVLALGIGASTAVFSVLQGVVFRPLPLPEPDRLVMVRQTLVGGDGEDVLVNPLNARDLEQATSFVALAGGSRWGPTLEGVDGRPAERLNGAQVDWDMFRVLGRDPQLGRAFLPEDQTMEAAQVVVISHGLWQRRFNGDPGVLGMQIRFSGRPSTIVGVMPPDFVFPLLYTSPAQGGTDPEQFDIWRTFAGFDFESMGRSPRFLEVVGRLAEGVTPEQADAELRAMGAALTEMAPEANRDMRFDAVPVVEFITAETRTILLALQGAALLLLITALVNATALFLARTAARRSERAVRVALGAGRWQAMLVSMVESTALVVAGTLGGLALAGALIDQVVRLAPSGIPRLYEVELDGGALIVTLVLAAVAAAVCVSASGAAAGSDRTADALREGREGGGSRRALRTRRRLVSLQVALAVLLVCSSVLLLRSLRTSLGEELGFDPERRAAAGLVLPLEYGDPESRMAFYTSLSEAVEADPAVSRVGFSMAPPLGGSDISIAPVVIMGEEVGEIDRRARILVVDRGFFDVLDLEAESGRLFQESDDADAPPVALVNQAAAERFWAGRSPLGGRLEVPLNFGQEPVEGGWEIVGVVENVRHRGPREPASPTVYIPLEQRTIPIVTTVLRTQGSASDGLAALRRVLGSMDPGVALHDPQPLGVLKDRALATDRFAALVLGLFAAASLLLAVVGIYGIQALSVSLRRRELGLRMALGAERRDIVTIVLREAGAVVGTGLLLGLPAALALGLVIRSLLYRIDAVDVGVVVSWVAVGVFLLGLLSAALPARRAARGSPTEIL